MRPAIADLWRFGVLFGVPTLALAVLAEEAAEDEPFHLDRVLVPGIGPVEFEPLAFFFGVLAGIGGSIGLIAVASLPVAHLLRQSRYASALFIPAAVLGGWIINRIMKIVISRPRPEGGSSPLPEHWKLILAGIIIAALIAVWPTRLRGYALTALVAFVVMAVLDMMITMAIPVTQAHDSFPSGHAVGSMALASSLVVVTWRTRYRWLVFAAGGMFAVVVGVSRVYFGLHYASDIFGGWLLALAWTALLAWLFRSRLRGEAPEQLTS